MHNCFVGADGVCGRCASQVEQQQQVESDQDDQTASNGNVPNPPDAPNDLETSEMEMCLKCYRTSTDKYKLNFQSLHIDSTHQTMFGRHLADVNQETIKMCQQCTNYNNNNAARHKDWPNAWPSVMYTLLFETHRFSSNAEKLYKKLPHEIKESHKQHMYTVHPSIVRTVNESVLRDIPKEREDFWTLINSRTAKNLINALTEHCFPIIRCPAGCFEFVEKAQGISFAHFLNWIYPLFTSFNADSRKFLNGIRDDFTKPLILLEKFKISPCLVNNENGLQLVTCSDHKNGVKLKYVHVPTNPATGNVSTRSADRLALMVSSVRTVRPLKIGAKSCTFTMCRVESGRTSGVSSTVLHKFRNFETPPTDRLVEIEKLMINCRNDVKDIIRQCCGNFEISKGLAEYFLAVESLVSISTIEENCKSAVVFDMESLMRMKDYVESCPEDVTDRDLALAPLHLGHKHDDYGCDPRSVSKRISENCDLFPFVYAFITQDSLWSKLLKLTSDNENLQLLCKSLYKFRQYIWCRNNYSLPTVLRNFEEVFTALFPTGSIPLSNIVETLENCSVKTCQRGEVTNVSIDCSRYDTLLFVATGSNTRDLQVPFELTQVMEQLFI